MATSDGRQSGWRLQQVIDKILDTLVVGPSVSVDENIAIFDGTTGKLIKDSGVPITDVATGSSSVMRVFLRG